MTIIPVISLLYFVTCMIIIYDIISFFYLSLKLKSLLFITLTDIPIGQNN